MKTQNWVMFVLSIILSVSLAGCAAAATPDAATSTPSAVPQTNTPEATATATLPPSPTPLPGSVVFPVDTLGNSIPWLPTNDSAMPGTYYFYFNLEKPPFNSVQVREAFAAAVDRDALVEIAKEYGAKNAQPATTFTPSETLGRDLYNEVGIPFDPAHAKEMLTQAGYTDASKFPTVELMISTAGSDMPGFHVKITEALVAMWQQHLGVNVTVTVLERGTFLSRIGSDPSDMFRLIIYSDINDPDDFLKGIFHTGADYNYGGFSNSEFDTLVERAAGMNSPAKRQELYIEAERILCETEIAIIPIFHATYP